MNANEIGDMGSEVANLAKAKAKAGFDRVVDGLYQGAIALERAAAHDGAGDRRVCVATFMFERGQARAEHRQRNDAVRDYRKAGRLCRFLLRDNGKLAPKDKDRAKARLRTCEAKLVMMGYGLYDRLPTRLHTETRHAKPPASTSPFARNVERHESEIAMLQERAILDLRRGLVLLAMFVSVSCWGAFATLRSAGDDGEERGRIAFVSAPILIPGLMSLGSSSFFFLRRHAGSDAVKKYYYSEITYVEERMEAIGLIHKVSDDSVKSAAISRLMQNDRNPVLNEGQTTPLLEQLKVCEREDDL